MRKIIKPSILLEFTMECERLQLSWGMGFLDTEYPKIETGETVLIRGRRSSNEILINHMICEELSKRQPVYWIDGGMRLDPSLLIPTLLKKNGKITNLDYLYASRGFTAHQMLEIIKRLAREKENKKGLHSGRLIIISDLVNMFMDEQVSSSEGKSMLKKSLSYIKEIAMEYNSAVILTIGSKQESFLSHAMRDVLESEIKDSISIISQSREIMILESKSTGIVVNPLITQNYISDLQEVDIDNQVSKVVWTHPLESISSSEIPKGDKSAKVARRAKV
jgi:hypothetical protein